MARHALGASLLALALVAPGWAAESGPPLWITLDPDGGAIDGRTAMAFLPVDIEAGPSDPYTYFLDPADCTAHYILKSDLDTEEVHPCDQWVQPSSGRYFAWLEQGWTRTPYVVHGIHSGGPFRGQSMISSMELAPAGRVALAEPVADHSLHVLHLDSHLRGEYPQREIFRRIPEARQKEGALLPEGPVVPFLFDTAKGEYVWVAPQAAVTAGKTTTVTTPEPTEGTALLVTLIRHRPTADYEKLAIDVRAGAPGEERPPDVAVPGVYQYHALWHGLDGKFARVVAETDAAYLVPMDVPLRAGKVEALTERLQPKPNLEAILDLPLELPPAPRSLQVLDAPDRALLREVELPPETARHRIEALRRGSCSYRCSPLHGP